jgi:hypothetical protein
LAQHGTAWLGKNHLLGFWDGFGTRRVKTGAIFGPP